jgi:hypothetical protein
MSETSARAYVEQVQQWNVRCGRCGRLMGDTYDSVAEAQNVIEEYAMCSECENSAAEVSR